MENINLIDTFSEFKELKNIDRPTMMSVLEDVFRGMLAKRFGSADNFDIIVNIDKGDFEIWRNREVVDDDVFADANTQIPLSEAKQIDADYEVGEEVSDEVKFLDFGRRAILSLRQNLTARILDLEKNNIYAKYKTGLVRLSRVRFIRFGKERFWFLTTTGMNLFSRKANKFLPTISAKVIRSGPLL